MTCPQWNQDRKPLKSEGVPRGGDMTSTQYRGNTDTKQCDRLRSDRVELQPGLLGSRAPTYSRPLSLGATEARLQDQSPRHGCFHGFEGMRAH